MDKTKSTTTTASGTSSRFTTNKLKKSSPPPTTTANTVHSTAAAAITTSSNTVLSRRVHRVLQDFLVIWLDSNVDKSKNDFKKSIQRLRHIVASVITFTDVQECIDFLSEIKNERVYMIVSGSVGRYLIPEIHTWPQLNSIYIFCGKQSVHEEWANAISKIKGVYTKIKPICKALQIDREQCDQAMISISFHGIDALFMCTPLLKEVFSEIDDDKAKSIKELVDYCRLQDDIPENEIANVEQEYNLHKPIWWYTAPCFISSMFNRGFRLLDVDIIFKMGFFIRHLHQHVKELYHEQQAATTTNTAPFEVFRGQALSMQDFEKMKQTEGGLMSFNNFLSTSRNRNISLQNFACPAAFEPNSVGILFVMNINPKLCAASSIPFVNLKDVGYDKNHKEDILFSIYTIFRIDKIQQIHDDCTDRLYQVNLTLTSNNEQDLNILTERIREEFNCATGWPRLGRILMKIGEFAKAEQLYHLLLEKAHFDKDRADYNDILGQVNSHMGEYSKALLFFQRALDIRQKALHSKHPDLAASYNNIGLACYKMGKYSKALLFYNRALSIDENILRPDHPDLAKSYNNIGLVYYSMNEYSKALSFYEKDLEINQKILPPNHSSLANSYINIGLVYSNTNEHSKALSFYQRALDIDEKTLPPNHPDLAKSYNNIGLVYYNMGAYPKALSFYEKDLKISKKTLPSNHPDLATSYYNIGLVYYQMKEYSKAISFHEKSLDIRLKTLSPNHPDLAYSYGNTGSAYDSMGEYSKALTFYEKAHAILEKSLPSTHPHVTKSKTDIELVKKKL